MLSPGTAHSEITIAITIAQRRLTPPKRLFQAVSGATKLIAPLERLPYEGELIALPDGAQVKVRHVMSASRDDLAGVVLACRLPVS
jgi:hypothetical protein